MIKVPAIEQCSKEEARAIYEFLDQLRDLVWILHGETLTKAYREDRCQEDRSNSYSDDNLELDDDIEF